MSQLVASRERSVWKSSKVNPMKPTQISRRCAFLAPALFTVLLSTTAFGEQLAFGADYHQRDDILGAHLRQFYPTVEVLGIVGDLPKDKSGSVAILNDIRTRVVPLSVAAPESPPIVLYTEGNHDDLAGGVGDMTPSIALHYNVCGLSALNAAVFREDVVNDLKGCLEAYRTSSRAGKVTFIMSHLPLHSNRDDGNDKDDDLGTPNSLRKASDLFNVLQDYGRKMNLVFLWGHDHFDARSNADLETFPSETIGGTVLVNTGIVNTPLKFTYLNAGYIDDDGEMTKSSLTATWFRFYRSRVNIATLAPERHSELATLGRFTSIATGNYHSCGIRGGSVYCWGYNGKGQLGNGSTVNSSTPVQVTNLTAGATQVSVGRYHSCAIVKGEAKCWGYNGVGQLGNNSTVSSNIPVSVTGFDSPTTVREISAGQNHTCAVVDRGLFLRGSVKCWGYGAYSALGNGTTANSLVPVQVTGLTLGATRVSVSGVHSCAVQGGTAKCWGTGTYGSLGDNTTVTRSTPINVKGLNTNVTEISAGNTHSCAVAGGAAYCWGTNDSGQLGDYSTTTRLAPVIVSSLTRGVTEINAGGGSSCATVIGATKLDRTGVVSGVVSGVRCWGNNADGQLGDGSTEGRPSSNWVTGLLSGVTQIDQGSQNGCAVHNGYAKCWGYNGYGQLGNGTIANSNIAVEVTP